MRHVQPVVRNVAATFLALLATAVVATPALATDQVSDVRRSGVTTLEFTDSATARASAIRNARNLAAIDCQRQGRGTYIEHELEVVLRAGVWFRPAAWAATTEGTCSA